MKKVEASESDSARQFIQQDPSYESEISSEQDEERSGLNIPTYGKNYFPKPLRDATKRNAARITAYDFKAKK